MTLREQIQTTLGAIIDLELRNQVRHHLVSRVYARKHWVCRLEPNKDWDCKAIARIVKEHGDEEALPPHPY